MSQVLTGAEGQPITLSADIIGDIRTRQEAGEFDKLRVHGEMVQPGVKVTVEGNLSGLDAVVARVKNERAVGLIANVRAGGAGGPLGLRVENPGRGKLGTSHPGTV